MTLRCPVCRVGNLRVVSADRRGMLPFCGGPVGEADTVRRKRCDWCALAVVTVERIAGMLTPPNGDRIEELSKARLPESGLRYSRD